MKKPDIPKKLEKKIRQWLVYVGILFILVLIILLFNIDIVGVITIIILMIIASFSKIYKRFTGTLSLGFELVTPVTILFAYKISILFSLVAAFIMLMVASFIAGKIDFPSMTAEMITYLILAILTAGMRGFDFVTVAVIMVFLRNIIMYPMGIIFLGRNFIHLLIVVVTDAFFNVLIVVGTGNFIASLL